MKFIRTCDVLASLFVVACGGGLIYVERWNEPLKQYVTDFVAQPWGATVIGVLLILIVLLRVLAASAKLRAKKLIPEEYIDFKSGDASMKISTSAVKGYIQGVGDQFSELKSMSSELVMNKDHVDIRLRLKLKSGERVRELIKSIRMRVRDCMCEELGLDEKLGEINIDIEGIDGMPGKPLAADKMIAQPQEAQTAEPPVVENASVATPAPVEEPSVKAEVPPVEPPAPDPEPVAAPEPVMAAPAEEEPFAPDPTPEPEKPVEVPAEESVSDAETPAVEKGAEDAAPAAALESATDKEAEDAGQETPKLDSETQYIFKPKQKQAVVDEAMAVEGGAEKKGDSEVELTDEENPLLQK